MALPLLVGLGVRTVASYTMKYGIPAAKEAYKAYLKKNPAMKKKIKGTMTDFFKKPSIVSAGNKFKNVKTTKTRKTNTPRTEEAAKKAMQRKKAKADRSPENAAQTKRNRKATKLVGTVTGVGTVGAGVYEAAKGIRASSEAKAEAARKAKLAKNKADEDRKKAKKKTDNKTTSTPSRKIDNTADYSRRSSDYRSGMGSGSSRDAKAKAKRPSYFQDIDAKEKKKKSNNTGGVKTRFGGRVTTRSGSLRTRGN